MGFRPKQVTYNLKFEDPDLDGLEVKAKPVTLEQFFSVLELAKFKDMSQADVTEEDIEKFKDVFLALDNLIASWNIDRPDGTPLPITEARTLEFGLAFKILMAVFDALVGVDVPLDQPSKDGELLAGLPMETATLSSSQPS